MAKFLQFLASKNLKIERIDSEGGMLTMINDLRATGADAALVSFATRYWENLDEVMKVVNDLRTKFHLQVIMFLAQRIIVR